MTFAVRYHYAVVLLEQKNRPGGAFTRIYTRERGIVEGLSPGAAATILEARYRKKNQVMESITLRLGHKTGSVVFETQESEEDLIPQKHLVGVVDYSQQAKDLDLMADEKLDIGDHWKWCTQIYSNHHGVRTLLRVEEHLK